MNNIKLMQMLKNGNPQQIAMSLLQQQAGNNPMMRNVLDMANSNNEKGIEELARNICKEKGVDADQMLNYVKNNFGK